MYTFKVGMRSLWKNLHSGDTFIVGIFHSGRNLLRGYFQSGDTLLWVYLHSGSVMVENLAISNEATQRIATALRVCMCCRVLTSVQAKARLTASQTSMPTHICKGYQTIEYLTTGGTVPRLAL